MTGLENIQAEILSDNRRINGELLADADQVRILDVVPLSDLHVAYSEALSDAAQDISGCHRVDDVIAVVYEASVGILPAAGHVLEFFLIDVVGHFCNLLYVICFCEINIAYGVSQKSHTLYVRFKTMVFRQSLLNQNAVAMIDLMLDDLRRKAGVGFESRFHEFILILYFNCPPALGFSCS